MVVRVTQKPGAEKLIQTESGLESIRDVSYDDISVTNWSEVLPEWNAIHSGVNTVPESQIESMTVVG